MKYRYSFVSVIVLSCLLGKSLAFDWSARNRNSAFDRNSSAAFDGVSGLSPSSFGGGNLTSKTALTPQLMSAPSSTNVPVPIDNSIDEDNYIIGGGDVFFISFSSASPMQFTAAANRDGNLFIPELGMIKIGNVPLKEARDKITDHLISLSPQNRDFYVALIKVKDITVTFSGMVQFPGSYELPATMRLVDAIVTANAGTLQPAEASQPEKTPANLRQVQVTNGDSTIVYDLLAYLYKGDYSQNPYISPGDRIGITPMNANVSVYGMVRAPATGQYPLKNGESLRELLSIFTLDNTADTNNIIIFRASDNQNITVSLSEGDYYLNNRDAITIPVRKNLPKVITSSIFGEIASPGYYPIIEGVTTARQLIEIAGEPTDNANMNQALIVRRSKSMPMRFRESAATLSRVRPEGGTASEVAATTQDYTVIRLLHYNIDKLTLEHGDQLIIPKIDNFVYISGSVKQPGAYLFQHGRDVRYYISSAGGLSKDADKSNIQVFIRHGDYVYRVEAQCVEPGSIIVVPPSIQHKFLSQVLLPLVTTVVTTIGVGMSIYSLRRAQ